MVKTLVLSFIANDETGIIDRVTEIVLEAGGNWSESRMAHLAEKFAGQYVSLSQMLMQLNFEQL